MWFLNTANLRPDNSGLWFFLKIFFNRIKKLIVSKIMSRSKALTPPYDVTFQLQLPDEWSIILVHEPEEGGEPFGVVEVSNRDWEISEDQNLFHIMAICIFLGALLVFYPANNYRNKEEE